MRLTINNSYFRDIRGIGLRWDGEQFFAEKIGKRGDFYKAYPPK